MTDYPGARGSVLRDELARYFMAVHHRWEHGIGGHCPQCAGDVSPKRSDPWGVLADECIRQMRWAWLTGSLQGTDATMSCGYSRERILRDYFEHNDYPHIAKGGDFEARHKADIHLAPEGWNP